MRLFVSKCSYIVLCGGCFSAVGKGAAACSIGLLLRLRGHNATYIKLEPYLNSGGGASTLSPMEHGESFTLDDGTESDCDLGHCERIMGVTMSKANIVTSGTLYKELIEEQEQGKYLGQTIQVMPHLTDKIQKRLLDLGKDHDIVIAEIGGTVGDQESFAFFEAMRQFKERDGGKHREDVLIVMVAPVLWVNTIKEFKTKPLQNAVKELQRHGLQPDVLFCRSELEIPEKILNKVSMFTGVKRECVIPALDVSTIYQIPINFYENQVDDCFVDLLRLNRSRCNIAKYRDVVEKYVNNHLPALEIGVFGKYDGGEAYISLKEALTHAGITNDVKININWIKSDDLEKTNDIKKYFKNLDGIIVPGGFDNRGVEGKIKAIQYVRENKIPFLGICLGLQCAVIEFARNVCNLEDANSTEFDKNTTNPVVHFVKGQEEITKKSGTMRLGAYDCEIAKDTLAYEVYKKKSISERHRHRYEVNQEFIELFNKNGLLVTGVNPQSNLVEIMELSKSQHPYFLNTQAHPEFKSRLNSPAPLFDGLVKAILQAKNDQSPKQAIQ